MVKKVLVQHLALHLHRGEVSSEKESSEPFKGIFQNLVSYVRVPKVSNPPYKLINLSIPYIYILGLLKIDNHPILLD